MSTKSRYGSTKYHLLLCPECPRAEDGDDPTYDIADLQDHLGREHLDDFFIYRCPNCVQEFTTAYRTKKHMKTCFPQLFTFDQNDYTRPIIEVSEVGLKKINHWLGVAIKNYGMQERRIGQSQMSDLNRSMHNTTWKEELEKKAAPQDRSNNEPEIAKEVAKKIKPKKIVPPKPTPNNSMQTLRDAQKKQFYSSEEIREMNYRGGSIPRDKTIDYTPSAPPLEEEQDDETTSGSGDLRGRPAYLNYDLDIPIASSALPLIDVRPSPSAEDIRSKISSLNKEICQEISKEKPSVSKSNTAPSPIPVVPFSFKGLTEETKTKPDNCLVPLDEIRMIMKRVQDDYQHKAQCVQGGRCDPSCPKLRRITELIKTDTHFLDKVRDYSPRLHDLIQTAYGH